jgi:putative glutamine amidotransferase
MPTRPVIAVTGPDTLAPIAYWATSLAIKMYGATPVRLTASTFHQHRKETFQAIIIGGGSDIDPGLYGQGDEEIAPVDPARDAFEVKMIEHALAIHLPILGICRGAQLINVVLGGTLFGDIRRLRMKTSNRRNPLPSKRANLVCGGRVAQIFAQPHWWINSLHSQAIDGLGEGLKIVVRDDDQFVQAVESIDSRFIVGVQWHPEYLFCLGRQRRIFGALVEAAKATPAEAVY